VFATSFVLTPMYCWLAAMFLAAACPPLVLAGSRPVWRRSRGFAVAWGALAIVCGAMVGLDLERYRELYSKGLLPGGLPLLELLCGEFFGPFGAFTLKSAGVVAAVSGLLTLAVWWRARASRETIIPRA
jgi:hypothetical protein